MTWYKWRPNIPHPYSCICQCGDLPTIEKRCKIIWGQSWSEVAVSTPGSSRSGWVTWCWLFLFFENKKHFDILSPTTDENKSNWSPARKIVQIGKVVQINKRVCMACVILIYKTFESSLMLQSVCTVLRFSICDLWKAAGAFIEISTCMVAE